MLVKVSLISLKKIPHTFQRYSPKNNRQFCWRSSTNILNSFPNFHSTFVTFLLEFRASISHQVPGQVQLKASPISTHFLASNPPNSPFFSPHLYHFFIHKTSIACRNSQLSNESLPVDPHSVTVNLKNLFPHSIASRQEFRCLSLRKAQLVAVNRLIYRIDKRKLTIFFLFTSRASKLK
jgi:hypothetical protein